jgi:hypothetical protein
LLEIISLGEESLILRKNLVTYGKKSYNGQNKILDFLSLEVTFWDEKRNRVCIEIYAIEYKKLYIILETGNRDY